MFPTPTTAVIVSVLAAVQALGIADWGERLIAVGYLASQGARINLSTPAEDFRLEGLHAESFRDLVHLAPTEIELFRIRHPEVTLSRLPLFKNSLKRLILSFRESSPGSLRQLSELAHCEELALTDVSIEDSDFELICNRLHLKQLRVDARLLSPTAILALAKLQRLEVLQLRDSRLTPAATSAIAQCMKLKSLSILNGLAGDGDIVQLRSLRTLKTLSLSGTQVTDLSAEWIAKLPNLKGLNVSSTQMTTAGLAQFRALPQLEYLYAYQLKAAPKTNLNWAEWSIHLKSIMLTETRLGEGGLQGIGSLSNLDELLIEGTDVGENDVNQLKGLRRLSALHLNDTRLSDASLKEVLPSLSALATLYADGTEISDESLEVLLRHPTLQSLSVRETNITRPGGAKLMRHFGLGPNMWAPK